MLLDYEYIFFIFQIKNQAATFKNFAMIWPMMNIGMDDDRTQKRPEADTHATGQQKNQKIFKIKKKCCK